jgi:hypothetical protein
VFLVDFNPAPVRDVPTVAAVELLRNGIVTYRAATPIVLFGFHRLTPFPMSRAAMISFERVAWGSVSGTVRI